ncbi:MAG: hypothetical protein ABS36_17390 [Acidobacteria bacterium SCN 69-37]|nr:MAG: hypothetical protein ABS36_17390 [Acidobacteria bacterium SCN 69-37]
MERAHPIPAVGGVGEPVREEEDVQDGEIRAQAGGTSPAPADVTMSLLKSAGIPRVSATATIGRPSDELPGRIWQ